MTSNNYLESLEPNYFNMNLPFVTIGVLTYNSSEFIIETLESIKAQTYPRLILQISDDCSTDNTIELCENWIEKNKERFEKTKIIVPDHNTGVSGNANRDWDACETEWLKEIAGDDLLMPNCIEDSLKFVEEHSDAILVFSKVRCFGVSKERCKRHEERIFDYSFFNMSPDEQFERIKYASCLPTTSAFYNITKLRQYGLRHDERIPLLEDRPKWLNAIRMGIKFHFFDKETVLYRLHEESLSNTSILSPKFYESTRLAFFYYAFQKLYQKDQEDAIKEAVRLEMEQYKKLVNTRVARDKYYRLSVYRIIDIFKRIVRRIK